MSKPTRSTRLSLPIIARVQALAERDGLTYSQAHRQALQAGLGLFEGRDALLQVLVPRALTVPAPPPLTVPQIPISVSPAVARPARRVLSTNLR